MTERWRRASLAEAEPRSEKSGTRRDVCPELGRDAYGYSVAVLKSDRRLSANAYHYREYPVGNTAERSAEVA